MSGNIDKIKEITNIGVDSLSLFNGNAGETVQNSVLENDLNFGKFDDYEFNSDVIPKELEEKVIELLDIKLQEVVEKLTKAENHAGLVGSAWSAVKNTKLFDKITDGTIDVQKALDEATKVKTDDIKTKFETITGAKYTRENVEKFLKGDLITKSEQALNDFDEGQELAKDLGGDLVSGILSGAAYAAVGGATVVGVVTGAITIAAAIPTILGAVAVAGTVGALTKVGMKFTESSAENNKYETFTKDAATGAIGGVLSPLAALGFGKFAGSIVTKLGGSVAKNAVTTSTQKAVVEVVEEGIEEVAEQVAKKGTKFIPNLSGNTYEGSNLIKAVGYSTEYAGQGAVVGAAEASARVAIDGGTSEEVANAALQGTAYGAAGGLVFGWGFKAISGIGSKGSSSSKTYKIEPPTSQTTNGKLYSGLPIPELSKALGKTSKAVTVDDVVEEYLKQRFLTMKYSLRDGSYEELINSPKGSQNPFMSFEISPRTFVEDVLFNDNTIGFNDAFAFYNFKSKFNMDDLRSAIEFLLDSYQATMNPVAQTVQRQADDIVKVSQGRSVSKNSSSTEVQPQGNANSLADDASDATGLKTETPPSNPPVEKQYVELQLVRGKRPKSEDDIITILNILKEENNIEIYNEIANVYNRFCGVNRKGNEDYAKAFADELQELYTKYSTNNEDAYKALAKKYLADEVVLNKTATPSGKTESPSGTTETPTGNTDSPSEPSTPVQVMHKKLKIISDLLLEDASFAKNRMYIDGTVPDEDIANLATIYIKNAIRSQKRFTPISELKHSPDKILDIITKMKGIKDLDKITDAQVAAFGKTRATVADIKNVIKNYRIMFLESAINCAKDEDIPVDKLIKYFNKEYGWNLTKIEINSIIDYVNIKQQYVELFDVIKTKVDDAILPENIKIDNVDDMKFIVDFLNKFPDFDFKSIIQNKNPVDIRTLSRVYKQVPDEFKDEYLSFIKDRKEHFNSAVVYKWLNDTKINSVLGFMDYMYLSSYGIPDEKLVSKAGSILDVLGVSDRKAFKNFMFGGNIKLNKNLYEKLSERVDFLFKAFGAENLDELKSFFVTNGVKNFTIQSDLADPQKMIIKIDFSGKNLSIKERIKTLTQIFKNMHGRLDINEPYTQVVDEHNILQEIAYRLSENGDDYKNILQYLGLNNKAEVESLENALLKSFNPKTKKFNYIDFRKSYGLNDAKKAIAFRNLISNICDYLDNDNLDILNGVHGKLRFFERFYFISEDPMKAFEIFEESFNGTVKMCVYENPTTFAPQCFITPNIKDANSICLTLDKDLKVHTLYTVGWRENL